LTIYEAHGSSLEFNSPTISGKTGVYCLIGDPVDHSLSPAIQNAAFRAAGIDAVYAAFSVRKRDLKTAVHGLRSIGVRGFNVTTPHKTTIMTQLDQVDATANQVNATNTIVTGAHGDLTGYNTDGIGAVKALQLAAAPLDVNVLLVGAGGAGRAIALALAPYARSIKLANRTLSKAKQLERAIKRTFELDITCHPLTHIRDIVQQSDLIINASSMGMNGQVDLQIEENSLSRDQWVMDIVYRPQETRLLGTAARAGARTLNGLDMLLGQGAYSFELWTGRTAPVEEMRRALTKKSLELACAKNR
jgi:shikimate dehydrogenase